MEGSHLVVVSVSSEWDMKQDMTATLAEGGVQDSNEVNKSRDNIIQPATTEASSPNLNISKNQENIQLKPWKCGVCFVQYHYKSDLETHISNHHPQSFICHICNSGVNYLKSLRLHMKKRHGDHPLSSCDICDETLNRNEIRFRLDSVVGRIFTNERKTQNIEPDEPEADEMDVTRISQKHVCEVCQKPQHSVKQLEKHMAKSHPRSYVCKLCNAAFSYQFNLVRHERSHSAPASNITTENTGNLKVVIVTSNKNRNGENEKKVTCHLCFKVLRSKKKLSKHMRKHIFGETQINSNVSDKIVEDTIRLNGHNKLDENNRESVSNGKIKISTSVPNSTEENKQRTDQVTGYSCNICSKTFQWRKSLKRHKKKNHLNSHTDNSDHRFVCSVCDLEFTERRYLLSHERFHFNKNLPRCNDCELAFNLERLLKKHLNSQSHKKRAKISSKLKKKEKEKLSSDKEGSEIVNNLSSRVEARSDVKETQDGDQMKGSNSERWILRDVSTEEALLFFSYGVIG